MKSHAQLFVACLVSLGTLALLMGCAKDNPSVEPLEEDEVQYFFAVAMGAEYGDSGATIKKWTEDLRIKVSGAPTTEDNITIGQVVAELNELQDQIRLDLVDKEPNVEMIFAPEAEFSTLESNYQPTNYGFFWVNWD